MVSAFCSAAGTDLVSCRWQDKSKSFCSDAGSRLNSCRGGGRVYNGSGSAYNGNSSSSSFEQACPGGVCQFPAAAAAKAVQEAEVDVEMAESYADPRSIKDRDNQSKFGTANAGQYPQKPNLVAYNARLGGAAGPGTAGNLETVTEDDNEDMSTVASGSAVQQGIIMFENLGKLNQKGLKWIADVKR